MGEFVGEFMIEFMGEFVGEFIGEFMGLGRPGHCSTSMVIRQIRLRLRQQIRQ